MNAKGRILVVDDDRRNVMLLATRLRALGYAVLEASNGLEALQRVRAEQPDLVLSDVMMPVMDGIELTRQLKADPVCRTVPVVLVTAFDDLAQRKRGLDAGADDFLGKPLNPLELELRVRGQMRLRHLQQEMRGRVELLGGSKDAVQSGRGGKVFVVEDDARWRSVLETRLRAAGHEVVTSDRLSSGLASVDGADPDVIIVDMLLPDGSGVDFIREFRDSRHGDYVPTILVVSCVEDAADKLHALRSGADDYLVKPVAPEELEARIQAQLRRARTSRMLRDQVDRAQLEAARDGLTGLFNRRFLDADLQRRTQLAQTGRHGFCLAMLDIDHFKQINDIHGHAVGDAVLRSLAARLTDTLRESDLVCRYGGEEFCVVLPATGIEDAFHGIERVRAQVARMACAPLAPGEVTVSAGVAAWQAGEVPADVLARADAALYAAKHAGRNRVQVADGGTPGGGA